MLKGLDRKGSKYALNSMPDDGGLMISYCGKDNDTMLLVTR